MILFQMIYKPCQKWTWPKTLLWQSWYLSTNMPAARSNSREIPKQFCKTKFKKTKSINGQFESLLFTFEPLECDNKEDLCYWNLEFIDRNQSIIVLVFFLCCWQGREKNETATLLSGQNLVLDMALHTDISTAISSVSKCTFNHSSCHSNRKNRKKTREIWRRIAWSFLNNQPVKIFYSQ